MLLPLFTSPPPEDSLEMPPRHIVTVGNRASVTFRWEATDQQQCWGSSGWPVISPLFTEPFRLFLAPRRQEHVSNLFWPVQEIQKVTYRKVLLGGGIADSQSTLLFLAGPYTSSLADRILAFATCHWIIWSHLVCQSQVTTPKLKGWPHQSALWTCWQVKDDSE